MIHFQDIVVCYKARERYPTNALEGIDLDIAPGEWVFFVGPSGAGKSTLLKLIYHGHGAEALQGKITVDGQDITHLKTHDIALLRRKIGVVFQDFQLLAQKTVWENVAFALQVIGTPQSRLVKDVPRALDTVGLTHKAHAHPHELSGGEQQRIAIARAIVNDPTVLILDEPTGNLDPQTGADIADVLQKVNARGTTILMATHDRNLVDSMRRRVVRIADGRIISDEPNGIYHPEDDGPQSTVEFDRTPVVETVAKKAEAEIHVGAHRNAPSHFAPIAQETAQNQSAEIQVVETETAHIEDVASRAHCNAPQQADDDSPKGSTVEFDRTPSEPKPEPKLETKKPAPRIEPPVPDYVTHTLQNHAPLGSPENPIVQLDRK